MATMTVQMPDELFKAYQDWLRQNIATDTPQARLLRLLKEEGTSAMRWAYDQTAQDYLPGETPAQWLVRLKQKAIAEGTKVRVT